MKLGNERHKKHIIVRKLTNVRFEKECGQNRSRDDLQKLNERDVVKATFSLLGGSVTKRLLILLNN